MMRRLPSIVIPWHVLARSNNNTLRSYSSVVSAPKIYVSESHDPFFNLAFEDWIFRKTDSNQIILFLYRNTPSIIIGRNQNPWKEINLHQSKQSSVPFVRRKSGGGTVYHDLGNTNYCVFVPRLQFERNTNASMVSRALNKLEIPAFVNDRNDICVETFKMRSAFKLVNARAYHHGTMLIDAKLGNLRGLLGTSKETLITKGVASVPSPVKNLREWSSSINHQNFVTSVAEEFTKLYGGNGGITKVSGDELLTNSYASDVVKELKSWDWMYGQTPEFTHEISLSLPSGERFKTLIKSRHALITSIEPIDDALSLDSQIAMKTLADTLPGDRYGSMDRTRTLLRTMEFGKNREILVELVDELEKVM